MQPETYSYTPSSQMGGENTYPSAHERTQRTLRTQPGTTLRPQPTFAEQGQRPRTVVAMTTPRTPQRTLLTPAEVAEMLRVDPWTVRRYIKAGQLPAFRFSDRVLRIDADDVAAFLDARRAS